MSLEAKLKEQHGDELQTVDDIEELALDGLVENLTKISESDKAYLERFSSLIMLSMSNLGLTTLENLPKITTVESVLHFLVTNLQLLLNDNKIKDGLEKLEVYPNLTRLELENNLIENVAQLAPLVYLFARKIIEKFKEAHQVNTIWMPNR